MELGCSCIIHAGGAGGVGQSGIGAAGFDEQPLAAIANPTAKLFQLSIGIGQLLGVFTVERFSSCSEFALDAQRIAQAFCPSNGLGQTQLQAHAVIGEVINPPEQQQKGECDPYPRQQLVHFLPPYAIE